MYICIYVYMYIRTCVYMHTCTYVYMYISTYICVYIYICIMYICTYVCIYIYYTYVYLSLYTYIYIYMHVMCIYIYIYIHMYIYTHICTYTSRSESLGSRDPRSEICAEFLPCAGSRFYKGEGLQPGGYTQFAIQDSRLFGPNPSKILENLSAPV